MTFSERLGLAMKEADITQGALAEAVGMAQPSVWKLVSGGAKGSKKSVEIARVLGVRPEWLSSGRGPMRDNGQQPVQFSEKKEDTGIFRIDVLDLTVSAGPGTINNEFVEVLRSVEYSVDNARQMFGGRKPENLRIINVKGDSMSGVIEPGDLLFIDIAVQRFDGDGIYAFLYDDVAHVKRLQMMKDKLLVISDNKIYVPWDPIERDEMNRVFIFGKVIGSMPQTYRKHG